MNENKDAQPRCRTCSMCDTTPQGGVASKYGICRAQPPSTSLAQPRVAIDLDWCGWHKPARRPVIDK